MKYTDEIQQLFCELRILIIQSVSCDIEEKLWAKIPSYYDGDRFIRLIPFKDHINIEAAAIIENKDTLGFVRYLLIPTKCPIIINWNLESKVAEQVCENDIVNRKINTFKCLVNGDISLSWNTNNIII